MPKKPVLLCTAALLSLALAGCSGGDDSESPSESATASASEATSSSSSTPSPSDTSSPTEQPSDEASDQAEAAPAPATEEAPADTSESDDAATSTGMSAGAQAFFDAGGACDSDTFPTGPPSPELMAELQAICAAQAGDEPGYAGPGSIDNYPMYPDTEDQTDYSAEDGDGTVDTDGYQRPEADADGYVGPSDEYYDYGSYVEPGFEYQVGSECFDADLGRCKTSGEIQTEYMDGAEVEDLMREEGIPLPSER